MTKKYTGKKRFKVFEPQIFGDKAYAIFEVDFDNDRLYSALDVLTEDLRRSFRNRDYETKLELCLQALTRSAYMYYIYDQEHICSFKSVESYIEFHDDLIPVNGQLGIKLEECSVSCDIYNSHFIVEEVTNK